MPGSDLLSHGENPALPSALSVFTSEFGMGSGGSRSLWPPGKLVHVSRPARKRSAAKSKSFDVVASPKVTHSKGAPAPRMLGCYMVKPHGQLVSVS